MRPLILLRLVTLTAAVLLPATLLAATAEESCQKGRHAALAKYLACEEKTAAGHFGGGDFGVVQLKMPKCHTKYRATWAKLQAKATGTGSFCDAPRFQDNGDGTVTDRLSALRWEQKTDDASIHDKDNGFSWTAIALGTAADGTAYTSLLATLNGGACFAGECDWRLPTRAELQTILLEPYPCATSPCIDTLVFGPSAMCYYWTSTTYAASLDSAWGVDITGGGVNTDAKTATPCARAVRGGL